MANSTVLSVGSVTISANGGATGDLLAKIVTASAGSTAVMATGASLPTPPAGAGPFELVVPAGYAGSLSIPSGYKYVVYSGSGNLTGGDSTTAIIGNSIKYTGAAGTIVGAGGNGVVSSTGNGAMIDLAGGGDSVTATGRGDVINVNGNTITTGPLAAAAAVTGDTIDMTGTLDTVFDTLGSSMVQLGMQSEYVSAAGLGTSTLTSAAGGADTIFALSGVDYNATAATSSLFLGSNTSVVSVQAGTGATLFGGAAGGTYTEGTSSVGGFFFWGHAFGQSVAAMTSDTVIGTASSPQATVWGNTNENVTIMQPGASLASGKGNEFVAWGGADTINAMNANGGNTFIAWNASLPSGANFTGDTTLVGSNAGNDAFVIFSAKEGGLTTASAAHTITIDNWQASDLLYLSGYSSADISTAQTALTADAGKGGSFTLSDGTKFVFTGVSPTTLGHN